MKYLVQSISYSNKGLIESSFQILMLSWLDHHFEGESFVENVEPELGISGATVEEEKRDLLPVADDVDDRLDQDGEDGEDDEDDEIDEDDQDDVEKDVKEDCERESVGLPSTLPQITWKYKLNQTNIKRLPQKDNL